MGWSEISKAPLSKSTRRDTPDGLWHKCHACNEIMYKADFEANQHVCLKCHYHNPIPARERLLRFFDTDSFVEIATDFSPIDPLSFVDKKSYRDRLREAQERTGEEDAFVEAEGLLAGRPIVA